MKLRIVLALTFLATMAYANISLFSGKWTGAGELTINGKTYAASPVKLEFTLDEQAVSYVDRFHFVYEGQDLIMRTSIGDITFIDDGFYYGNKRIGELIGNKIISDHITSNGTRQVMSLRVTGVQMEIRKAITKRNGVIITESAIVTRE